MQFLSRKFVTWQSTVLVMVCLIFAGSVAVQAQTPGIWDGVATNGAVVVGSMMVPLATPPSYDSSAGLTCVQKKIPTRRSTTSPQLRDDCWHTTKWGLLSKNSGWLVPKGYDVAGKIYVDPNRYDGRITNFRPTSNPDVLIHSFSVVNGMNIYRRGDSVQFKAAFMSNGGLGITADFTNATQANTSVSRIASSSYFSDNNRWAVRTHRGTVTRYDMDTMRSVSLGAASTASLPVFSYADIDNSGRYIVFSLDNSLDAFKVIDMDTCTLTPDGSRHFQANKCASADLRPKIVAALGYTPAGYGSVKFIGEAVIQGWAEHPDSGQWYPFQVYAPSVDPNEQKYLALGDSFASGEGAYNYIEGTDTDKNKCHLSTESYPYLFLRSGAVGEMRSLACAGARMEHIRESGKFQHADLRDDENIADFDFTPGVGTQLKASKSANYYPTVVTVSISGNDIGFADKITECVLPQNLQTCFNTYHKRLGVAQEIMSKHDELVRLYAEIKGTAAPEARIYAIGYPQIVEPRPDVVCGTNVLFNDAEREMAYDLVTFFNAVIKHAAATAGVQFVGVESAFGDQVLCGGATKAVNGFVRGNDGGIGPFRFVGKESYHPNSDGHRLLHERIKAQTNNLTSTQVAEPGSMPDPANYPFLANMESTNEPVPLAKNARYLPTENTVVQRGNPLRLTLSNITLALKPFTTYTVELHSDPVQVGTVTTNGLGEINAEIVIPADIDPGLRSVHILGNDERGDAVDVYEYLYIAASDDDFDGDGVLDADESCGILEPSGVDHDQDGVDDACDTEIGQPPESDPDVVPDPEPENPPEPDPADEQTNPIETILGKVVTTIEAIVSYTKSKIENIINQFVTNVRWLSGWLR